MSGITGIYNLDGRPADASLLRRMTDAIAHRGPDGAGHWVKGQVALGHRMLHTTPESLLEKQPLTDESGTICLTLDGRVDNREELRAALEAKGARLRDDTDAELVLRAYECWGEECPAKILGDFAFALWNGRKRQLFCARDFLGSKPFYYYSHERRFVWGSLLSAVLEDSAVPREPNEGMIGEYLARNLGSHEETLYQGIFRLAPAHALVVKPEGIRKFRYWQIDPEREIRHRTDAEYADHFRELFRETVRCRLRAHGKVGVYLSGGLDSSSVAVMAQRLLRQEFPGDSRLEAFSVIFPGMVCDESNFIQDVARQWDIPVHYAEFPKSKPLFYASFYDERARHFCDFPGYPNDDLLFDAHRKLAREKGFRVLLGGLGADEWLTGSFYHYGDLLRRLRIRELVREIRANARAYPQGSWTTAIRFPRWPLLRLGVLPLLPESVFRGLKWALRRNQLPGVHPEFARRIHLRERINTGIQRCPYRTLAQRETCKYLFDGWLRQIYEVGERSNAFWDVEERSPFMDKRLIEFSIALPEEQRWRREQTKFVLRQAMKDILPESVRTRLTKVVFPHTVAEVIQGLGNEGWLDSLRIASFGWVDGLKVQEMYREMLHWYAANDLRYAANLWRLWMILAVEIWYRAVFEEKIFLPEGEKARFALTGKSS